MLVKIIETHCIDHPVPATVGWLWAWSYFWINIPLYLMLWPQQTIVINVTNKCNLIFKCSKLFIVQMPCSSSKEILGLLLNQSTSQLERKPRLCVSSISCLCVLIPRVVKTLLLIIYWAVMKWQMIYWEPKTLSIANVFLLLCHSPASILQPPKPQIKRRQWWRCWPSLRKAQVSDRTLFLILFNSLLLLKNSICLIELFDSKIWIPCILSVHINFPSYNAFINVIYRQKLNLNLVTSQAYKKIWILAFSQT